jgi:hypothetical protein
MLGLEAATASFGWTRAWPKQIGGICIQRMHALGAESDVEAVGAEADVRRAKSAT